MNQEKQRTEAGDFFQAETLVEKGYWVEITITTTLEAAEMVGEVLIESGCGGIVYHDPLISLSAQGVTPGDEDLIIPEELLRQETPYRVSGYLPFRQESAAAVEGIKKRLLEIASELPLGEGTIALKKVKEEDWANAWKAYFKGETVGAITITPSWLQADDPADRIVIKVDPGMAFGTGSHPSTRLSLLLLQRAVKGGERVYDIGTGTGILAISAAKLGAKQVTAVDIDPVAVEVAGENISLNQVENQVTASKGNLVTGLPGGANLIVANIIAEVIIKITPEVSRLLKPNGAFLTAGIIESKAPQVKKRLLAAGFRIETQLQEDGWVAFLARRG